MVSNAPTKASHTWSPFLDWIHLVLTVAAALLLLPLAYGDVLSGTVLIIIGYLIASLVRPLAKKYAVKKTVIFDIHGVYITGDLEVENFYEVEGTKGLIQRLRKKYKVAALTNMSPEMYGLLAGKWGFSKLFDYVYYSGQYKIRKPDARIFEIILKDLHANPKCTVFLDDRTENVDAAKKLGMHGIVFKDAKQAEAELNKMGFGP